jgi:hypothetical protein
LGLKIEMRILTTKKLLPEIDNNIISLKYSLGKGVSNEKQLRPSKARGSFLI